MHSKFVNKQPLEAAETKEIKQMPEDPQLRSHQHGNNSDLDKFNNNETAPNGVSMVVDSASNIAEQSDRQNRGPRPMAISLGHIRSLSVYPELSNGIGGDNFGRGSGTEKGVTAVKQTNDGPSTSSVKVESRTEIYETKRFISHDELAELALVDPKKAKRILNNRRSAARSKEKQIRYTNELENKVDALQVEATNLFIQLTILQIDTSRLTAQNEELKMRVEAMQQEAELRDAVRRDVIALQSMLTSVSRFV